MYMTVKKKKILNAMYNMTYFLHIFEYINYYIKNEIMCV